MSPLNLIGLITSIFVIIFIINDTKKRGMSQAWALIGLLGLIGLIIYLISRKQIATNNINQPMNQDNPIRPEQNISQEITIPDICPHCKNPNGKKIRLCEWCGGQIC